MHGQGKSDRPIVPENAPNKVGGMPMAEAREGRGLTEGNARQSDSHRIQCRARLQQALARVRQAAERDRTARFTAVWHLVADVERLREAFSTLKRQSAPGIDGETWQQYEAHLEANLVDLAGRLHRGAYHAKPVKRVYIPKTDGKQRPIGIPTLEDKIVQRATAEVLQTIYEVDFHAFSYGFRPGRSQHDALDTLAIGLQHQKLNWVLDADIRGFFDTIDHDWLLRFLEHRIADKRVGRHVKKWLQAGVLEDGQVQRAEYGTPQGGSISPLLANLYLHYAFDNWAACWQRDQARGDMLIVRFADDIVVCFQYREDAERFQQAMQDRLGRFHLDLHQEKTRLIEFGRFAENNRAQRGAGKPETFDFLGFTHRCGKTKAGKFVVKRQTARKKMRAKLRELAKELRARLHDPVREVGQWLARVVKGHYQYYAVPFNYPKLNAFRSHVLFLWKCALRRRSQKEDDTWVRANRLAERWLPRPRILHPYPGQRRLAIT